MHRPRLWTLRLLAVTCALSIGGCLYLAVYTQRLEQRLRVDPFELEHYVPIRPLPAAAPGIQRIVLMGDSRARSWPEPPAALPAVKFENRGIGYQTTSQVLGRLQEDALALEPSALVFQVGINDLKAVTEDAKQRRRFIERCKRNIAAMVEQSVRARAYVVVLTVAPIGPIPWYARWQTASDTREAIAEVNRFLYTLASDNVSVFDTNAVLADDAGWLRADYRLDYLHINELGYAALDRALNAELKALLPKLGAARRD